MHEDLHGYSASKQYRSLLKRSFYFFSWQTCGSLEALAVRFARADDLFSAGLPIEPRGAGRLCSTTARVE